MNKLLLFSILLYCTGIFNATASTNISGQIRSNTTWTKAGSPYICTGTVEIAPDAVLTIDPGVTVILQQSNIVVYGSLIMNATAADSITFKAILMKGDKAYNIGFDDLAFDNSPLGTYNIQYCNFDAVGINFNKNPINLEVSNCRFTGNYGLVGWSGDSTNYLRVHDNFMSANIWVGGHSGWRHSGPIEIYDNDFYCAWANNTINILAEIDTIFIRDNKFRHGGRAIFLMAEATAIITGNVFYDNQEGIHTPSFNVDYYIADNVFAANDKAIFLVQNRYAFATIKHNSIYNNDYGILVNQDAIGAPTHSVYNVTMDSNCIYDNKISGLCWGVLNNFSIGANWWGSTDTLDIDTCIKDFKDDFHLGAITYRPFLPNNSGCKTYTPPTTDIPIVPGKTKKQITSYPNPFGHSLTITAGKTDILAEVVLYNITGVKVAAQASIQGNTAVINTRQLPAGMYIYLATYADHTTTSGKVLKQ